MKVYVNEYYGVCATTPEQATEEVLKKRSSIDNEQIIGMLHYSYHGRKNICKVAYLNWRYQIRGFTLVEYEVKGA